jgi:hypothetical protein
MKAKTLAAVLLTGCAILGGMVLPGTAQENKPVVPEKKIEAKGEKYTPASTIDFGGELGLPLQGLTTLGGRIEAARRTPDPVALAVAGLELAAAEKVSGKNAGLSSEAVFKEVVYLAKVRSHSKELLMVAELLNDKDLRAEADRAARFEKGEAEAAKAGETPRGTRYLRVWNRTRECTEVYVNGECLGHVEPGEFATFPIYKRYREVRLFARHHHRRWGPARIDGDYDIWTWELND